MTVATPVVNFLFLSIWGVYDDYKQQKRQKI